MNDTLHLTLKAKWYDMIESGIKTEEYREIKPYWLKRLCTKKVSQGCCYSNVDGECEACFERSRCCWTAYPFVFVRFSKGYTRTAMTFEVQEISFGKGNPAWGAPEDEDVFIIKLGRRIA